MYHLKLNKNRNGGISCSSRPTGRKDLLERTRLAREKRKETHKAARKVIVTKETSSKNQYFLDGLFDSNTETINKWCNNGCSIDWTDEVFVTAMTTIELPNVFAQVSPEFIYRLIDHIVQTTNMQDDQVTQVERIVKQLGESNHSLPPSFWGRIPTIDPTTGSLAAQLIDLAKSKYKDASASVRSELCTSLLIDKIERVEAPMLIKSIVQECSAECLQSMWFNQVKHIGTKDQRVAYVGIYRLARLLLEAATTNTNTVESIVSVLGSMIGLAEEPLYRVMPNDISLRQDVVERICATKACILGPRCRATKSIDAIYRHILNHANSKTIAMTVKSAQMILAAMNTNDTVQWCHLYCIRILTNPRSIEAIDPNGITLVMRILATVSFKLDPSFFGAKSDGANYLFTVSRNRHPDNDPFFSGLLDRTVIYRFHSTCPELFCRIYSGIATILQDSFQGRGLLSDCMRIGALDTAMRLTLDTPRSDLFRLTDALDTTRKQSRRLLPETGWDYTTNGHRVFDVCICFPSSLASISHVFEYVLSTTVGDIRIDAMEYFNIDPTEYDQFDLVIKNQGKDQLMMDSQLLGDFLTDGQRRGTRASRLSCEIVMELVQVLHSRTGTQVLHSRTGTQVLSEWEETKTEFVEPQLDPFIDARNKYLEVVKEALKYGIRVSSCKVDDLDTIERIVFNSNYTMEPRHMITPESCNIGDTIDILEPTGNFDIEDPEEWHKSQVAQDFLVQLLNYALPCMTDSQYMESIDRNPYFRPAIDRLLDSVIMIALMNANIYPDMDLSCELKQFKENGNWYRFLLAREGLKQLLPRLLDRDRRVSAITDKIDWTSQIDRFQLFASKNYYMQIMEFSNQLVPFRWRRQKQLSIFEKKRERVSTILLNVDRDTALEDLMATEVPIFDYSWQIRFNGEDGFDAGGLLKEYMDLVAQQMSDPRFPFWELTAGGYLIPRPPHIDYDDDVYSWMGQFVMYAMIHDIPIRLNLAPCFIKGITDKPLVLDDLQDVDPLMHRNLLTLLRMDPETVVSLGLDFTVMQDNLGEQTTVELKPNGADHDVTGENRKQYALLLTRYYLRQRIAAPIEAFRAGFYKNFPSNILNRQPMLNWFDVGEISQIIGGAIAPLNVQDMRRYTVSAHQESTRDTMFWELVKHLDTEQQSRLLRFWTGSSLPPASGFRHMPGKQLRLIMGSRGRLPESHTCFNELVLSEYDNIDMMRDAIQEAIMTEGFLNE